MRLKTAATASRHSFKCVLRWRKSTCSKVKRLLRQMPSPTFILLSTSRKGAKSWSTDSSDERASRPKSRSK